MSQLTDAMTAAINTLKTSGAGMTNAQVVATVHSVVDPEVADLQSKISAIMASEMTDESKLSDVTDALNEFTTAFAPAAVPTALTVTGVVPNTGPVAGGTSVVISGTGFTGATGVTFGGVAATSLTVVNDTTINATTPAGAAVGSVDVLVTTPAGTSAAGLVDQFAYA